MNSYRLYGCIVIADMALPLDEYRDAGVAGDEPQLNLLAGDPQETTSLPIFGERFETHGQSVCFRSAARSSPELGSRHWAFDVGDLIRFWGRAADPNIYYQVTAGVSAERLGFWFAHHLLPVYLSVTRGHQFVHAAAVEVDGQAILFLGPSGCGKSSLAAEFVGRGHALVGDDKVAFVQGSGTDRLQVIPSHSRFRPYRRHEDLGRRARRSPAAALTPVAAFVIEPTTATSHVHCQPLRGADRFGALSEHALYLFRGDVTRQFESFGPLADQLDVYTVEVPRDRDRLPEVYRVLRAILSTTDA